MTKEYELTLVDYLSIMRSRAPYLIGIFVLVLLIAVIVVFSIPPTYRASGTILVESTQSPDVVAPRTGRNNIDERINVIKQRVMTREGLIPIINKYRLFGENAGSLASADLIDKMRNRVAVESISSDSRPNQFNQQTIAFTISFEDRRPEVALQVTNDLVAIFLQWNVKLRTEGATEAATFLAQETERLKAEVDGLEEKISAFKKQHNDNLPEQLSLRATIIARAENDLYLVEHDIRSGNEELRGLEAELSSFNHGASGDQTLPALKAEYARLSGIYTESHPDIQALRRKIDALRQGGSTHEQRNTLVNVTSPDAIRIKSRVDAVNARLESLRRQKKMLQEKIAQNENAMERAPGVAQSLDVLIRDRDSAQRKFDEIRNKKMNAEIAQNLESENKSERFSLLEPPILPEKPFKPDRVKLMVLGFFLALGSSGGMLMVLPTFDRRVRGVDALSYVLGYRPLAVIPYLVIQEEEARRKRTLKLAAIAAISTMSAMSILLFLSSRLSGELFAKMLAGIS